MKRTRIKEIYLNSGVLGGTEITVCGWAKTIRDSKSFGFIELNDGSYFKNCQIVFAREKVANYEEVAKQNVGACLKVTGKLVLTPENKQPSDGHTPKIRGAVPLPHFPFIPTEIYQPCA